MKKDYTVTDLEKKLRDEAIAVHVERGRSAARRLYSSRGPLAEKRGRR